MSNTRDLVEHPPAMAEMAGAVLEANSHPAVYHFAPDEVPIALAALEAETEI